MIDSKNQINKKHPRNNARTPEHQEYRDNLSNVLNDIRSKEILTDIDTPEILVKINQSGGANKFVHLLDEIGREYLIALSMKEYPLHSNIVSLCEKVFKKKFRVIGGGYMKKEGNKFKLYGKSDAFGEANMSRVKTLLSNSFPNANIEYDGKEKSFDLSTERSNTQKFFTDKEVKEVKIKESQLLLDNSALYSDVMDRESKKGLGKEYLKRILHIYSSIDLNAKTERLDLDEGGVKQCLDEYGPKLGYDYIDDIIFPDGSKDICVAVRSVENGVDYGYSAVYLVWKPNTEASDFYRDFFLFKEIANTKKTKDYLNVKNVVLDKESDILKLNISTGGGIGGQAISKNIEIDLQKELNPITEETNRFPIEKEYNGFSGKERLKHILNDLEEVGYLSDLDGEKFHFLDVSEFNKEDIYERLEMQGIGAGSYLQQQKYTTPKPKKLKVVMLKFNREKDQDLTEANFIEKMKTFGLRPMNFEEYLQFVSGHSKYIKEGKGYIYMPENVVSPERYTCRVQAHKGGIGMDVGRSIFGANFPFVIEE